MYCYGFQISVTEPLLEARLANRQLYIKDHISMHAVC